MTASPRALFALLVACVSLSGVACGVDDPAIIVREFIYETAPFPSCHASTIAETPSGLVAAWFGGKDEGEPDVGIWFARRDAKDGKWSSPVEVANGVQSPEKRYPCWNPVLFQAPSGALLLFYKVGPQPTVWWGMLITSDDAGKTWSAPRRLPEGILGPIKNKPILYDGELVCPSSTEQGRWRAHMERTKDWGASWSKSDSLVDATKFGVIQPTLLVYPGGKLQALMRSQQRKIVESWSSDAGRTWSPMAASDLPNPDSGIDAVNLKDGRALLVYNHTPRGRTPLNIAVSSDGHAWQAALTLETEPGEYSYPAVIATRDGMVHITYTWHRRRIRHVAVDPAKLTLRDMPQGNWPK
ncbi:MAG TPA: sialidase family protein [Pirellulales bacterium]|jgi:predicted neuraminidase|nr:sialidase family protein [Pirellulales bacterium]